MHTFFSIESELIKLEGFASSMQGGRPENQDDLGFLNTPLGFLFVLCDGMGGGPGGKTASDIVKRTIAASLNVCNSLTPANQALRDAFCKANEALEKRVEQDPSLKGMGSTAVTLLIRKNKAYVAHAGDSRCYLIRNGKVKWRTVDHSLVSELVQRKTLTEEQARVSAQSNIITRALGATNDHTPDIEEIIYEKNDRFVLCSDGVWSIMSKEKLIPKFMQLASPKVIVTALQEEIDVIGTQKGGGHDNHSLAIIDIKEESSTQLNMIEKLRKIIYLLGALCSILVVTCIMCVMGRNSQNANVEKEHVDYKRLYEAAAKRFDGNTKELIVENVNLHDENVQLQQEIDSLRMELRKKAKQSEKTVENNDGTKTIGSKNAVTESPKQIADELVTCFNNVINCKKDKPRDAVSYIDDQYVHINELLDKLAKTKHKSTADAVKRQVNDTKIVKNTVQESHEKKYVPTGVSSKFAKKMLVKIEGLYQ